MLGLGRERVVRVPADDQGRLRLDALPALDDRTILCAQAGNVNTGACDPIGPLSEVARDAGAWTHVDGAFGLWMAASPARAPVVAGVEAADSWSTDGHKWLNVSYDSGFSIVRDASALRGAMAASGAAYLQAGASREPEHHVPEMSRRARGSRCGPPFARSVAPASPTWSIAAAVTPPASPKDFARRATRC